MNLEHSQIYSKKVVGFLKEARLEKGISQNKLAEMTGLSRAAIQHLEKGLRNPTLMVCHALAEALSVSLASILKKAEASNSRT